MLEEKLVRIKKLMEQREKIDAELGEMLGISNAPKRGRPRKEQGDGAPAEPQATPQSTEANPAGTAVLERMVK